MKCEFKSRFITCKYLIAPVTFVKRLFSFKMTLYICQKLTILMCRISFWTLYYVSLICVSVVSSIPYNLDYGSFIVSLKDRVSCPPLFFFKTVLSTLVSLSFHTYFRISLLISAKKILDFWLGLCWLSRSAGGELMS